jgi:hypothetical protein
MVTYDIDEDDYGTVEYDGKTLILLQMPYCDDDFRHGHRIVYKAKAKDNEGKEYQIYWRIINENSEDELDACDWEDYAVYE